MIAENFRKRTFLRKPLAAFGAAMVIAGGFLFLILAMIDMGAADDNPYRSLVTFVGAPAIVLIGLALFSLSAVIQIRKRRLTGEKVRFSLSFNPENPRYVRNLWLFVGLSMVLLVAVAYAGTRAYDATDSVKFCGETCHVVMQPQNVTYQNSPHARVACVSCHIGPGASFWVKAKLDGIRQVFAVTLNTFSRPIETPVHNLRPAQETCEGCHWPRQFYGEKMVTKTYYRTDEANSPWTIKLLMKIGGGNPRTGKLEGIHWHMLAANSIEYIAIDDKRQEIPWVRLINHDGDTLVYTDPDAEPIDPSNLEYEVRTFDCMDCHNRPSHIFTSPAVAINLALSTRNISPRIPYIRQVGLDLLNAEYETHGQAVDSIRQGLYNYYNAEYPDFVHANADILEQASKELVTIYSNNFFPEMKTDYRVRENNLSHFVNDGCFRCHDGIKKNYRGEVLSNDCTTCHLIVSQGPSEDPKELESDLTGVDFKHPEDIDEAWREMNCTECHTSESGY